MLSIEERIPRIADARILDAAAVLWGIRGAAARALPGERDRNVLLTVPAEGGAQTRFVFKVSQADEDPTAVECQNRALERVAAGAGGYLFPRCVRSVRGREVESLEGDDGASCIARVLEYVPGVPLAAVNPHSPALLEDVGALMGAVGRALDGFSHPGAARDLRWDLRHGVHVVDRYLEHVADAGRRALVEAELRRFQTAATPWLPRLRTAVVHNDGNDHNVLAEPPPAEPSAPRRVIGLVDFGDLVHSWMVADPAITAAYAMLGKRDPLAAVAAVVRGYHRMHALTEPEIAALFPLATLRLCVSVVTSAYQRAAQPGNEYLKVSEDPAWALLERLAGVDASLAHYTLRHACGMEPCPSSPRLVAWMREHAHTAGPVLDDGVDAARPILDMSVGSTAPDAPAGAVGRYDEARGWNDDDAFRVDTDAAPEWRSIHIGIDLFAPPRTGVLAPLDGRVHSATDHARPFDYGPTVLLEHETADGVRFWSLYGHLSRDSVRGLRPGAVVRRGDRIGEVGDERENGGWTPHVHVQVMADLLGYADTFPGVARPSQRDVWLSISPDPSHLLGLSREARAPRGPDAADLLERRRRYIGPSLSVSYREPLVIVRGRGQYLYDDAAQPYLDCVNNVAHVGHSHPRVVHAIARQAAVLNTNTRYLHELLERYAERLAATLPEPLRVCFFTCSGSEANELALRIARAYTGARGVVALEGAYHGNTTSLIDISPYKFDGPGGAGAAPHVRVAPLPDPYRGAHRDAGPDAGSLYARDVGRAARALRDSPYGFAAFFCEPILSCAGQVVPPGGFVAEAFALARAAGGVCVADEVQVGFGRIGTHFWTFQAESVVPDLLTLGKPIGNGHPLGAVITTPEIAAAFDNGMEYFNTFGGNPVSCAAGLAVLDVIEEEHLQQHAREVGEELRRGLRGLMSRHPVIGDARGRGLFIGIELVRDRDTREPAGELADHLVQRMRSSGILLSTDGPHHNVVKIKPPLVFNANDGARLLARLDEVLSEDAFRC